MLKKSFHDFFNTRGAAPLCGCAFHASRKGPGPTFPVRPLSGADAHSVHRRIPRFAHASLRFSNTCVFEKRAALPCAALAGCFSTAC